MERNNACMPCYKFLIMAGLSLICSVFSMCVLIIDKFKDPIATNFCTSLICSILGYWLESPKMYNND